MHIRKVIIYFIVVIIALELSARILLSQWHNTTYDKNLISEKLYVPTDGLRANASGTVWGKPFHTDDIGGRRQTKIKAGRKRLLILGDEVAQGVGVADEETFANLINEKSELDVRNISFIGLCTPDYLRLLEDFCFTEDEESNSKIAQVYLFVSLDDIYCKVLPDEFPLHAGNERVNRINDFLQGHSGLYKLIQLYMNQNGTAKFDYDQSLYKEDKRVEGMISDIAKMNSLCREKSIFLKVFLLPYKSQVSSRSGDLPQRHLSTLLNKEKIVFKDLLPAMKKVKTTQSLFLFSDEIHLSAAGHHAVAHIISSD